MSMPPPPPPMPPQPPGYTPYGAAPMGSRIQPSAGLSKAMIILFWLTTAASALTGFGLYSRKGTWDDFVAGKASFTDLDDADSLVGGALLLQFALLLASAIVTCLWARRVAENAKARGVANVSPGLAAGGWFIPIGWFFVGFNELRKSVNGVNGRSPSLTVWQVLFVAQTVVLVVINRFGGFDVLDNPQEVSDALRNQGIVGLVGAAIYAVCTVFATKAAKEVNAAVTG